MEYVISEQYSQQDQLIYALIATTWIDNLSKCIN
jgi:hypothetical protein